MGNYLFNTSESVVLIFLSFTCGRFLRYLSGGLLQLISGGGILWALMLSDIAMDTSHALGSRLF